MKAIRVPSGDGVGWKCAVVGVRVRLRLAPPAAETA
jgi:hypothetical protein